MPANRLVYLQEAPSCPRVAPDPRWSPIVRPEVTRVSGTVNHPEFRHTTLRTVFFDDSCSSPAIISSSKICKAIVKIMQSADNRA